MNKKEQIKYLLKMFSKENNFDIEFSDDELKTLHKLFNYLDLELLSNIEESIYIEREMTNNG